MHSRLEWLKPLCGKVSYCEMNGILEALTRTRTSYTVLTAESVDIGHVPPTDVPLAGELPIAIEAPYAWFRSPLKRKAT